MERLRRGRGQQQVRRILFVGGLAAGVAAAPGLGLADGAQSPPLSNASFFAFDFRTLAAVGFFPYNGNLQLQGTEFNTYFFGFGPDFFNIQNRAIRASVISVDPYFVGLNWLEINSGDKAKYLNIALVHVGPHFRISQFSFPGKANALALGGQIGLAGVLKSDAPTNSTQYLVGADLALSISVTPDNLFVANSPHTTGMAVAGSLALCGLLAGVGALVAKDANTDIRTGVGLGGAGLVVLAVPLGIAFD
jgi:hypothetical protein